MYLINQLLQQLDFPEEYLEEFNSLFPNGVEATELLNENTEKEILYWIYDNVSLNTEEMSKYNLLLNISNSTGVYLSSSVNNSHVVSNSENINDSLYVFDSEDVDKSKYVVSSDVVDNSKQVYLSEFVYNSEKVYNGYNINDSQNIVDGVYVANSKNIYMSNSIFDSNLIYKSVNLKNCYFCAECIGLNNAILCQGTGNAEYLLFNKPIEPQQFEMIKKQFLSLIKDFDIPYAAYWPNESISSEMPTINRKITEHYKSLTAKFWKWVKTLPGYSNEFVFQLTFLPQFLTTK